VTISQIFNSDRYLEVQDRIREYLNSQDDFLSANTISSTRAVGDAIQEILAEAFDKLVGSEHCKDYSSGFARRAMADLAFSDPDDLYYIVDVKTHRLSTKFNMPNLTSVDRLARFYEDDANFFVVLMVAYEIVNTPPDVRRVTFVPIEFLNWDCLTIGAFGWGQIQIANSNMIKVDPDMSRKSWMLQLCDALLEFYPKELTKINDRMERFRKVRQVWEARPDYRSFAQEGI